MKLTRHLTVAQFERGYWYATELKAFAAAHGLPGGRKDQLEAAIKLYLSSGRRAAAPYRPAKGAPDRLALETRVAVYKNSPATKAFLEREARRMDASYRRRSGSRYRLNRWRDAQLAAGARITYRDLIREYVRLSRPATVYARIPVGRYINFLAELLAAREGTHAQARAAWHRLKRLDLPKAYASWKQHQRAGAVARSPR